MSTTTKLRSLVGKVEGDTDGGNGLRVVVGILAVALLLRPVVAHPVLLGNGTIASTMLIWMLFAASYNLLLGFSGLLSFGHAMFLGIGAYSVASGISQFDAPFVVTVVVAVGFAAALAYAIGRLIADRGEIYFALLTLAFAQAVHFIANADPFGLTGGANGLSRGTRPEWIDTFRGEVVVVAGGVEFDWYYFVAAAFVAAMLLLYQVVRSPFGRTLVAIRDNEDLARAMGIDTYRYKVWAMAISGGFSAVAGVLLSINSFGASLSDLGLTTSGDIVMMTVLGGMNYFFGPLVGAFIWIFGEEFLTDFEVLHLPFAGASMVSIDLSGVLAYWQFFFGAIFVVAVLVAPREGVWGATRNALALAAATFREVVDR